MKSRTFVFATAAVLTAGALAAPASAQRAQSEARSRDSRNQQQQPQQQPQQQQPAAQGPQLSREEAPAITPLYQAVEAQNWEAAAAAAAAAQAGARTPYGRFVVAQLQFRIASNANNAQAQAQAVDAMIASGGAPADVAPRLLVAQADLAVQAENWPVAEAAIARIVEANPNDTANLTRLAQVKLRLNKRDEATQLYRRVMEISQAAGQTPPENMYQSLLAVAYEARQAPQATEAARQLVTAYPTPTNWRNSLLIYRQLHNLEGPVDLDARRLMRATGSLQGERDFVEFAERLDRGGLPGEAKAVLDEGFARNQFQGGAAIARQLQTAVNARVTEDRASLPGLRTRALGASGTAANARTAGDVFYGYGQYADAAAMYRAALQKGGEDANLLNLRLGASLAQAGQRAEAETALRAVSGDRAGIAQFWLIWVQRRPAA